MPKAKGPAKGNRGRGKRTGPTKRKIDSDTTMIDCLSPDIEPPGKRTRKAEDLDIDTMHPQKKAKLDQDSDEADEEEVKEDSEVHVVINMELLEPDLKISYVDKFTKWKKEQAKENPEPAKPKRAKWTYNGPKPLNNPQNLPEGWTWDEPDLDVLDINAQIQRCKERIAEQIMPTYFEGRLQGYQAEKDIRDKMASSEKETYSWDVLQRIESLKIMEKWFETGEDKYKQLPNVKALLKAYRSRKLDWYGGLVTYWSHGRQLCEPRPHCWHEFQAINRKHKGWESFWVEGYDDGPEPKQTNAARQTYAPDNHGFHYYTAGVRLCNLTGTAAIQPGGMQTAPTHSNADPYFTGPNGVNPRQGQPWNVVIPTAVHPWWVDLEFLHDTGSSQMCIYQADLNTLMGDYRAPQIYYPMCTGSTVLANIGGAERVRNCIMVQVCLLVSPGTTQRMTGWVNTVASIEHGSHIPKRAPRTDDHFLRRTLYQGTQPDIPQLLRLSTTKGGLRMDATTTQDRGRFYPGSRPFGAQGAWFNTLLLPAPGVLPAVKAVPEYIG